MRNHKQVFTDIYEKEKWGKGKGSGTGSDPDYCAKYIRWLQKFIEENEVKSVLDLGCGDRQVYRDMDWSSLEGTEYLGVDVVESVNPDIVWDFQNQIHGLFEKIGRVDTVILKDVIMHWTNEEIDTFMHDMVQMPFRRLILVNSWKYNRKPEKNELPRELDPRFSWAPVSIFKEPLEKYGFEFVMNFKFKQVGMLVKT